MEEKRRLPSWMVNKVSKPLDLDENDGVTENNVSDVTESIKPKAKRVTRKKNNNDGKSFLVKCETKRKKRGSVEEDVTECRDHEEEVVIEKRKRARVGRKVEDQSLRKKKVKDDVFENGNECESLSRDEDDNDLTLEDLLTIAKEFIENDKSDMGQQKSSGGQCKSKSKSSYTSVVTQNSGVAPQDTRSHVHEVTSSHHGSLENTTSKVTLDTLAESRMTGDPAQGMLELFLGPLLNKPITKEEPSSIKDIVIPRENKTQQHGAVISKKPVTMGKKKSSLRDAVAMLLD